jgi:hypothetical protein
MVRYKGAITGKMSTKSSRCDPGGIRDIMQYRDNGYYPVMAPEKLLINWRGKLPVSVWSKAMKLHKTKSYRELAKEFDGSHESIRRALASAKGILI